MENKIILIDTSILIDYFRKIDKTKSTLVSLVDKGFNFSISAITLYEIYSGATITQLPFWTRVLKEINVLTFNESVAKTAVEINKELKHKRKQIEVADLFIAATAISNKLPIATLNKKHFERVEQLEIIN